jgi:crotonobetainyl-CoA:carnitine CoA-transferase CaiB-like acyl-CoA transferase
VHQNDEMLGILRARSADTERFEADTSPSSSTSASSAAVEGSASRTPNRLTAPTLIALLDARKTATTQKEVRQLAHAFDVDLALLESLVKYVNSPSIRPRPEEVRVEDEDDVSCLCARREGADVPGGRARADADM